MIRIENRMYPDTGASQVPPTFPKEFIPKFTSVNSSIYELELANILRKIDISFWPLSRHILERKTKFERIICLRRYKICA